MDSLCLDQLYFAPPSTFNDPMDCQPTVATDSNRQELRATLDELIKRRVKSESLASLKKAKLDGEKAHNHSNELARDTAARALANIAYNATDPEYENYNMSVEEVECNILTSNIQSELLKQYDKGVCCFSSVPDCSLLWSHYGDQHRGLCIGYSLDRTPKPLLHKVNYDDNRTLYTSLISRAMLQNDTMAKKELDENVLLRKASPWKYESEWRLFDNVGLNDSPLAMVDITFGLRCPSSIIHIVIKALENRASNINFYLMRQVRGSYTLSRVEVEPNEYRIAYPKVARSGIEIFGSVKQSIP
ncbi:DUF2971 domain-containing protein [Shewanella sp. UCD-FRSSP16_17]|uniref:DUF2971 domain-containing protein n=1 Tax=Shewanella sp. UCD-FRSSP16_17 TaxID=1853256 RepID=UPI0018D3657C|nr:DUF2971 domain-containing protein [Shewanella sp. UCD-FRSSP16_17]